MKKIQQNCYNQFKVVAFLNQEKIKHKILESQFDRFDQTFPANENINLQGFDLDRILVGSFIYNLLIRLIHICVVYSPCGTTNFFANL